jgi:tetratricopeptide (TPR) repeat protein
VVTDPGDLIAAGRAHLSRIEAAGDRSLTLNPVVAADTERLREYTVTPDGAADLDALYVHGWLGWYRHEADPFSADGDGIGGYLAAAMDLLYCYVVGMTPLPEPLLEGFADRARGGEDVLRERAEKLSERARASGDRERVSAAIDLWRRMIAPANPVHPEDLPMSWSNLGIVLTTRYELDGAQADLDEAIGAFRTALDLETPVNPERVRYRSNLSAALYQRAMITGSTRDREEALALSQTAPELSAPGDTDRGKYLTNVGISLLRSYEVSGEEDDLTAAIGALEEALSACGAGVPDRPVILSNLGNALLRRSELTGSAADLEASIRAHRDAVSATPAGHPNRGRRMINLSAALCAGFSRLSRDADLDEAIETASDGLALLGQDSPSQVDALFALGAALQARFIREGALADLDEGIRYFREAVGRASPSHANYPMFIGNLGIFLMMRHEWTGAVVDLDAAIEMGQSAVDAAPVGYVHRPALLSFLGSALCDRARLPQPPPGRSRQDLLDQAVASGEKAVAATPPGHYDRVRHLNALAVSLRERAELAGSEADLDEAVAKAEEAAQVGQPSVVDSYDAERAERLSNLASILRYRAGRTGSSADLDRALTVSYLAINVIPPDHHSRAMLLMNVGHCMRDEFRRRGNRKALVLARKMYLVAADTESATPTVRIDALREAAALTTMRLNLASISGRKRIRETAALLERAVLLLPEVAPRQLARADQQRQIGGFAGLASDAAAYALADERHGETRAQRAGRALSLLEHGRGIMLSQALDTRSDLTGLRRLRPDLAERYERLRDQLDRPPDDGTAVLSPNGAAGLAPDGGALALSVTGPDRSQLAREFAMTVAEIRRVDGLAGFMSPPPPENLADAAGSGTVVFNVSALRSDAILIKSSGYINKSSGGPVDYVPLPLLTSDSLMEKIELFRAAQDLRMGHPASQDAAPKAERMLLEVLEWLWDVAARPALDGLHFDGKPNPWGLYEVKWVPGGLLGQLPIHAAGRHRAAVNADGSPVVSPDGRQPPTVMDRVISSYAPTVRALGNAFGQAIATWRERPARSLIVAMPVNPGPEALADAAEAARKLHDLLPGAVVLLPSSHPHATDAALASGEPSAAEVLNRLNDCEIAHFMCHGVTDPVDPSQSRLLLGTGQRSDSLAVTALAPVRLGAARLAYLSACSTARNEVTELADESIHLASAFQLAGFPHVIGTLWEVDAAVARAVADEFYPRISADRGFVDVNRAATVLHTIIRDLRGEDVESPFAWAAYLHVGT